MTPGAETIVHFPSGEKLAVMGEISEIAGLFRDQVGPVKLVTQKDGVLFVNWANVTYLAEYRPSTVQAF